MDHAAFSIVQTTFESATVAERFGTMRFSRFVLAAVISVLSLAVPAVPMAAAAPGESIVDRAITFSVRNVNTSGVPCGTDGRTDCRRPAVADVTRQWVRIIC